MFRTPDIYALFVVHWFALLAIGIILTLFLSVTYYAHRYDQLLQRRSSMRGSLVALHIFSGMLKRHHLRKDAKLFAKLQFEHMRNDSGTKEEKIEHIMEECRYDNSGHSRGNRNRGKIERVKKSRLSQVVVEGNSESEKRPVQPHVEGNGVQSHSPLAIDTTTPLPFPASLETQKYRQVALDKFMGKNTKYTRPSLSTTHMLWGFKLGSIESKTTNDDDDDDDDNNNDNEKKFATLAPIEEHNIDFTDIRSKRISDDDDVHHAASFCQMLISRFIQEHELLALYYVNDRWLTRVHRSVIVLGRISIKISIVGTFFVVKNSVVSFWDSVLAVACGFVANKILGGLIKFLFVVLAKKRREHSLEIYTQKQAAIALNTKNNATAVPIHEQRGITREILKLNIEQQADHDQYWCWTCIIQRCCCCKCIKTSEVCFDMFSGLVWCVAIGSILFTLFFGIMFAFALENDELAAAWLNSVVGSIVFWLFVSRPTIIVIKTIISKIKAEKLAKQMNGKSKKKEAGRKKKRKGGGTNTGAKKVTIEIEMAAASNYEGREAVDVVVF